MLDPPSRDAEVMAAFDEVVGEKLLVAGRLDLDKALRVLTEAAGEALGAKAIACYLVDREPGVLSRKAVWPSAKHHGSELALDAAIPVALAVARSDVIYVAGPEPGWAEFAAPIPSSPLAARAGPPAGALSVIVDREVDDHLAALIRNASLRVALILVSLIETEIVPPTERTRADLEEADEVEDPAGAKAYVPRDIATVLPTARALLRGLWNGSASQSVTLRFALPAPQTSSAHGLGLVRLAATADRADLHPPQHLFQLEEEGGINWRVVRSGQEEYWPDLKAHAPRDFVAHRPNTRAQLCVPIITERRLVGVLNLESVYSHAYDHMLRAVAAVAQEIGRLLAEARLVTARRPHEMARHILATAHLIQGDAKWLADRLLAYGAWPIVHEMQPRIEQISQRLDALNSFATPMTAPGHLPPPRSTCDIFAKEIEVSGLSTDWDASDHPRYAAHAPDDVVILTRSFRELLMNQSTHISAPSGEAVDPYPDYPEVDRNLVRVTLGTAEWGGQPNTCLTLRPPTIAGYDPTLVGQLYVEPIAIELRGLRLGAYSVGRDLRLLGGEIYAAERDGVFSSTVLIPERSYV